MDRKWQTLVLDTSAIIAWQELLRSGLANELCTIPEVLGEVRDLRSKQSLHALPQRIETILPLVEHVSDVIKCSKQTGDYGVLSRVDTLVLALALQRYREAKGIAVEPRQRTVTAPASELPATVAAAPKVVPFAHGSLVSAAPGVSWADMARRKAQAAEEAAKNAQQPAETGAETPNAEAEKVPEHEPTKDASTQDRVDALMAAAEQMAESDALAAAASGANEPTPQQQAMEAAVAVAQREEEAAAGNPDTANEDGEEEEEDEDEEEEGWITPANIKQVRTHHEAEFYEETHQEPVALATTDFPMQNVAMMLHIPLVNVDGRIIKSLRRHILRCHACCEIVTDVMRQFCPKCGSGDTLKRVAYTVDDEGKVTYYINWRRPLSVKGTKYRLPKPRGGRHGTNKFVVLREDQLKDCGQSFDREKGKKHLDYLYDPDFGAGKKNTKTNYNMQLTTSYYKTHKKKRR